MERLQSTEFNHANQTNALRVALDDLHNASTIIFMEPRLQLIMPIQTYWPPRAQPNSMPLKKSSLMPQQRAHLRGRAMPNWRNGDIAKVSTSDTDDWRYSTEKLVRDAEEKALITVTLQRE